MTYIEKLKQAIKVDKELIPSGTEMVEKLIGIIIVQSCPRDFFIGGPDCDGEYCKRKKCWGCWGSEERH